MLFDACGPKVKAIQGFMSEWHGNTGGKAVDVPVDAPVKYAAQTCEPSMEKACATALNFISSEAENEENYLFLFGNKREQAIKNCTKSSCRQ